MAASAGTAATVLGGRTEAQEHAPTQLGTDGRRQTPASTAIRCDQRYFAHESRVYSADEMLCLKQLGNIANRQGDRLRVKLLNGKTKAYSSASKACENHIVERCIVYRLAGLFPPRQLITVYLAPYEGDAWLLLSRRTGNEIRLLGPPYFSPSGDRLVTMACDEAFGGDCGFDIWSIKTDPSVLEGRNRQYFVEFEGWRGDDHVIVEMVRKNNERAEIVRVNGKWELKPFSSSP